jgi:Transcriptional regulator PadR-like family
VRSCSVMPLVRPAARPNPFPRRCPAGPPAPGRCVAAGQPHRRPASQCSARCRRLARRRNGSCRESRVADDGPTMPQRAARPCCGACPHPAAATATRPPAANAAAPCAIRPFRCVRMNQAIPATGGGALGVPEQSGPPALHRLEHFGFVSSSWSIVDGHHRRTYQLTPEGTEKLRDDRAAWEKFMAAVHEVINT